LAASIAFTISAFISSVIGLGLRIVPPECVLSEESVRQYLTGGKYV
jgi:hypothetical protein